MPKDDEVRLKRSAGLILAGGEGKRWGGPKAWARLPSGKSFLECCLDTLAEAGLRPIVATLPYQASAPTYERLETITLPEPGLDMFASLRVGLERLVEFPDWSAVAVLPVDHPLVKSHTVNTLLKSEAQAVIPSFKGKHGHPIRLNRDVVEEIVSGSLKGPTLRDILKQRTAEDVMVDDLGVVSNCNTPEALSAALEISGVDKTKA